MFLMYQNVANQTISELPGCEPEISKWVLRRKLGISELWSRGFGTYSEGSQWDLWESSQKFDNYQALELI